MNTLPTPGSCCESDCDEATLVQVPGTPGAAGAAGVDGDDGVNAYTTVTTAFVMPAEGGTVSASVADTSWMVVGQILYINTAGFMQVSSVSNSVTVVLANPENAAASAYLVNAAPGTNIAATSKVSPAGLQGPAGTLSGAAGGDLAGTYPNPSTAITTTIGDIIVNNNNAVNPRNTRLAAGANGSVLHSDNTQATGRRQSAIDLSGVNTLLSGALPIAFGGSGQTTQTAAFNALSPLTTRGDLIVRDATNNIRKALGAVGLVLVSDGTDPQWALLTSASFATAARFLGGYGLLGNLNAANFNSTADQAITMAASKYIIRRIVVTNASVNMTTAAGGFYSNAGKAGTIIVAAAQVYTALTIAAKFLDATLTAVMGTDVLTNGTIYFSLTTAQGAPAIGDIFVFGEHVA